MNQVSALKLLLPLSLCALALMVYLQAAELRAGVDEITQYRAAIRHARESLLQEDLFVLRAGVSAYRRDRHRDPETLDALPQAGYLASIPVDPMTRRADSWQMNQHSHSISSGSTDAGSNRQPYNHW
jgi:general secretion pathway protein G